MLISYPKAKRLSNSRFLSEPFRNGNKGEPCPVESLLLPCAN